MEYGIVRFPSLPLVGKGRQAGTPAPPREEEEHSNEVAQASLPAHLIPDEVLVTNCRIISTHHVVADRAAC